MIRPLWGSRASTPGARGEVGRKVGRALILGGHAFLGFIDSDPARWGQTLPEGRIFAPDAVRDPGPDVACIVSIWHYRHSFPETAARGAGAWGFGRCCTSPAPRPASGWRASCPTTASTSRRRPSAATARRSWPPPAAPLADPASRAVFDSILAFRRRPDPQHAPPPDPVWPFDPARIVGLIDVGACIGEFCREALADFSALSTITAYEPDPQNYRRLIGDGLDRIPRLAFHPRNAAVSARRGALRFRSGGGWGSHIAPDGDMTVAAVALDEERLDLTGPTLLKMDIEGAEMSALRGMTALLASDRLIAMVTIEHRAEDLFEIPQILARRANCSLFLRARDSEICMDTCYISVPDGLLAAATP